MNAEAEKPVVRTVLVGGVLVAMAMGWATARAQQAPSESPASTEQVVDYNWSVRPILSENCFRCHGPDEKARMAGLRLDDPQSAYAALKSGNTKHAIVPGRPDDSEIIRRVSADNPAVRMPPRMTNKTLTSAQVEILRKWVQQGAQYKPHWAFIPPTKTVPPVTSPGARAVNDIDRFILAKLKSERIAPSSEADKETLINRVTLTLTGLPPTLADVDAFVNDTGPGAYEKVVDRLLASPAYGEHMAADWMNIARYSESDGFLDDLHDRLFWPYRDWLISAYNRNIPFDQFVTSQIAGDLLPSHTKENTLATAFLRLGKRTTENGAIDEEYRVEYAVERATTVGVALTGLTVGCARCHDHKYDPISQKDFYSLVGFFNSTDEPGFYAPGRTGITAGPTLAWADPTTEKQLALARDSVRVREIEYDNTRKAASTVVATAVDRLLRSGELASSVRQSINDGLVAYYPFEETTPIPDDKLPTSRNPDRRLAPPLLAPLSGGRRLGPPPGSQQTPAPPQEGELADAEGARRGRAPRGLPADLVRNALVWSPSAVPGAEPAVLEAPLLREGVKGKAFFFDDTNRGFLGLGVGDFERTDPFSLDLWVLAPQLYEDSPVLTHREYDWFGNAGYQLFLEKNRLQFELLHARAGNRIGVMTRQAVPINKWSHVTVSYDGSSRASGVRLYLDGAPLDVDVLSDNLTRTIVPNGGGALGDEFLGLAFGKRFRLTPMRDGAIDELRVFKKALTPLEVRYLHDPSSLSAAAVQSREVADLLIARDRSVVDSAAKLKEAREAQNRIISVVPEIPVMGDTPKPNPSYVLIRGQYTDHGEQVQPQGLAQVFPWNAGWPRNRLGLARWLFDSGNPLTARVIVNRIWQQHFGRGLVETSEDFGSQGSIPSHPELLDWLAVTFRESGWNVKRLEKLVVMSATYRQSSVATDELVEKDPKNGLFARFMRVRMPAELVRDNALASSGLLVKKVGGPSTYPYQPEGIWDGLSGYTYIPPEKMPADDQHRRTMYSFVKRNAPHPALAAFDFPDRGTVTVRRQTSNTPLQALVLLDDPQYLEAYRALATQVLLTETATDARIVSIFRLATRRRPTSDEMAPMRSYVVSQVARYKRDSQAARQLLAAGVTPLDERLDVPILAAFTNLTAAVMNTPDAYSLR